MESMTICPHCGGNACYEQKINEEVTTHFCFGCGYTTSTIMVEGSKMHSETLENAPELLKDLQFVSEDGRVWFPATITLPEKGMVFVDGSSKENWKWSAVKAVEIPAEEKEKFPKDQTHKMDMKSIKHYEQKDFMDALESIGFFEVAVAE